MRETVPERHIRTILVPVDFGEASARAVSTAGLLAARCGATLQLLHAEPLEAPAYFTHDQLDTLEEERGRMRAQCEAFLGRFGAERTSQSFTPFVDDQPPSEAILRRAGMADLVVMGTHGRRGASRWWLGSVAERVLRRIDRPLLVVRAGDQVDRVFTRPLVQARAPLVGEVALEWARMLAACFGGAVDESRSAAPATSRQETGDATLLVVAAPRDNRGAWLSTTGEPLITRAAIPVLFVPEPAGVVNARTPRAGEFR